VTQAGDGTLLFDDTDKASWEVQGLLLDRLERPVCRRAGHLG